MSVPTVSTVLPGFVGWWSGSAAFVGFITGCAWQLQQSGLWPWHFYLIFLAIASVGLCFLAINSIKNRPTNVLRRRGVLATWGMCALLLGFASCGLRAAAFTADGLIPALEGRDLAVVGVVAALPQLQDGGTRFRLQVESATLEGQPVRLPRLLQLSWYGNLFSADEDAEAQAPQPVAALHPGERWQMTVRLKAPHGNLNPHGFDYELWLWEQGVQATGYVRAGPKDPQPRRIGMGGWYPVQSARQAVRGAILTRLDDGTLQRQRTAGVLAALVTGDQAAIDRKDWDVFRATGVAHLMSISGLHITLFAWVAAALVGGLWRRSARAGWRPCLWLPAPTAAMIGGLVLATVYAVFSGWGVPAQRTVLMLATVTLLRITGRQWPWPAVWLLTCAVVVAADPWALTQAGFWLSFVAVGVLFATDTGAGQLRSEPGAARATGHLRSLLREQVVVTIALTPLSLLLFGQMSVVGLLANLIAIPWVTLVVTPLALVGAAVPFGWTLAQLALQPLVTLLGVLALWPFATISVAAAPVWVGAVGVCGGGLLAARLPWALRLLGLPLLLPVLLWQSPRPPAGQFEVLAADIGQGNAVILRTTHHTLVYDAGPRYSLESDAGHRVVAPLLRALGDPVDMLVLSHRDSDHTGGAATVLNAHPDAQLLSSIEDGHELQALRPAARCIAGQRWTWDGVMFEMLHPTPADYGLAGRSNMLSCVLRIDNGAQSVLLAGDIEKAQEARLVLASAPLRSTVLLVPHHGSKSSSTDGFLDAVQPRFALVQAGYRNRFGHPALPVLERYRERGITWVDSAHCGCAVWSSIHPDKLVCQRDRARRYWHHVVP